MTLTITDRIELLYSRDWSLKIVGNRKPGRAAGKGRAGQLGTFLSTGRRVMGSYGPGSMIYRVRERGVKNFLPGGVVGN